MAWNFTCTIILSRYVTSSPRYVDAFSGSPPIPMLSAIAFTDSGGKQLLTLAALGSGLSFFSWLSIVLRSVNSTTFQVVTAVKNTYIKCNLHMYYYNLSSILISKMLVDCADFKLWQEIECLQLIWPHRKSTTQSSANHRNRSGPKFPNTVPFGMRDSIPSKITRPYYQYVSCLLENLYPCISWDSIA